MLRDSTDPSRLESGIIDYSQAPPNLPALRWGRSKEAEAVREYVAMMRKFGHSRFDAHECGMYVLRRKPWMTATPDRVVGCECCDIPRILVVKCPYSL